MTQKETKAKFENRVNVDHITEIDAAGNKREAYLTKPTGFTETKNSLGADGLDTNEEGTRLYFFSKEELVGDYRLSNNLKGKSPKELVEQKHCLLFFESWYPAENRWVKQVAVGKPKEKSDKAVSI